MFVAFFTLKFCTISTKNFHYFESHNLLKRTPYMTVSCLSHTRRLYNQGTMQDYCKFLMFYKPGFFCSSEWLVSMKPWNLLADVVNKPSSTYVGLFNWVENCRRIITPNSDSAECCTTLICFPDRVTAGKGPMNAFLVMISISHFSG